VLPASASFFVNFFRCASESIQAFQKVAAADNTSAVSPPPGGNSWQLCASPPGPFEARTRRGINEIIKPRSKRVGNDERRPKASRNRVLRPVREVPHCGFLTVHSSSPITRRPQRPLLEFPSCARADEPIQPKRGEQMIYTVPVALVCAAATSAIVIAALLFPLPSFRKQESRPQVSTA